MSRPYRVVVAPQAADDIRQEFAWIQERNPRAADDWLAGMRETVLGLGDMPEAQALAPESAEFDVEIRRVIFGRTVRWRIYFTIDHDTVHVLHVRHGCRSEWRPWTEPEPLTIPAAVCSICA